MNKGNIKILHFFLFILVYNINTCLMSCNNYAKTWDIRKWKSFFIALYVYAVRSTHTQQCLWRTELIPVSEKGAQCQMMQRWKSESNTRRAQSPVGTERHLHWYSLNKNQHDLTHLQHSMVDFSLIFWQFHSYSHYFLYAATITTVYCKESSVRWVSSCTTRVGVRINSNWIITLSSCFANTKYQACPPSCLFCLFRSFFWIHSNKAVALSLFLISQILLFQAPNPGIFGAMWQAGCRIWTPQTRVLFLTS